MREEPAIVFCGWDQVGDDTAGVVEAIAAGHGVGGADYRSEVRRALGRADARPQRASSLRMEAPMEERLRYVADLAPARWIRPRLHPFAQDVGSLVPEGYEEYARLFHPASRDGRPVTWREIAETNGRTVHAAMQFGSIAGAWRQSPRADLWTDPPVTGTLPLELARELVAVLRAHTTTPLRCWFAVWEGWGGLEPGTPRFDHPNRRYYLALGAVDDATSTVYGSGRPHQSASLWWPDDRAWFVATEVDLDSTYLGGTRACVDAVLAHPRIEALRARLGDGITIASDELNPSPGPVGP